MVLKINLAEDAISNMAAAAGDDSRTLQKNMGGPIGYEGDGKKTQGSYEPAPRDTINENTDDVQKL